MSKVLVDRELLLFLTGEAELDGMAFGEHPPGKPFWWRKHLRAVLAQPAEAEGVSVPVEGYILDNNGYSFTRRREDFWTAKAAIVPLVRQSRHLAALSAVTAELENVREIQAETINARNSYQWELERVTAEVEGLRKALEQIAAAERTVYRDGYTEVENDSAIDCPGIAQTALAEYRAALAAKEA